MFIKRFSCSLVALAVLFCVSCPVFASGMELGGLPVGLEVQLDVVDFFNYCRDDLRWCYNSVKGRIDGETCPYAPTAGGAHKFEAVRTLVNGQVGLQWQCEYCHKNYGDAAQEAYQDYVDTLPGTQYNSDGAFLWVPGAEDFNSPVSVRIYVNSSIAPVFSYPAHAVTGILSGSIYQYSYSITACVGDCLDVVSSGLMYSVAWGSVSAPVAGIYTAQSGFYDSSSPAASVQRAGYNAGDSIILSRSGQYTCVLDSWLTHYAFPWPKFWVIPYTGGSGGNTYELVTRFSGTGNAGSFGYVKNGNLVQSSVGTIYNEETNIYQNPVTGDTSNISSWSYDYGDRSYSLITSEGDSISVTYGDSAVTINEGGTTYNVLYLVEEPEGGAQEAVYNHTHTYSASVTMSPTCTGTGVRTLTCTECGWQTTEVIPATGHNYSSSVVTREPTCTAPGVRTGTCTICGDEATEPIPALGHDYSSAVTLAPSCVASGVRTFTCSRCGDAYTESVPATGHIWQSTLSIPTQYDDVTGDLIQAGFTLYRCSNCGEEYRIDAASGGSSLPSASGGGASTNDAGLSVGSDVGEGLLPSIAQGVNRDLPQALEASSGWFALFPDYYSGWAEFLRDGISCLPAEIQAMIGFGFGVIVFLGLLLRIAGRR